MTDTAIVPTSITAIESPASFYLDEAVMTRALVAAKVLANSGLVPKAYAGKPEACLIALEMAVRTRQPPLAVIQNLQVINGNPSWSSKWLIAAIARDPETEEGPCWEIKGKGDALVVTCWVVKRGRRIEETVSMEMARADGWTQNPKYKSMPEVMLRYRSAAFLARFHYPALTIGLRTAEEEEDVTYIQARRTVRKEPEPQPADDGDFSDASWTPDEAASTEKALAAIIVGDSPLTMEVADAFLASKERPPLRAMDRAKRAECLTWLSSEAGKAAALKYRDGK